MHKQIGVFRVEAVGNEVGELRRFVRDMIHRQIHAQIVFCRKGFDVVPGAHLRVHFLVGQRREAAIGVGGKKRQDVQPADGLGQMRVHHGVKVFQIVADPVRVTDQLHRIFEQHGVVSSVQAAQ